MSLSGLLKRHDKLAVEVRSGTNDIPVRPRCYAADGFIADRVMKGKASPAEYASTFKRMRTAGDLPKYDHEVTYSDPVGGWGKWEGDT